MDLVRLRQSTIFLKDVATDAVPADVGAARRLAGRETIDRNARCGGRLHRDFGRPRRLKKGDSYGYYALPGWACY